MDTITPSEAFIRATINEMDTDSIIKIVKDDVDLHSKTLIDDCVKYGLACGLDRGFDHFNPRIVKAETDLSAATAMLDEISENLTGAEPYFERLIELRNRLINRHNETWVKFNEALFGSLSNMLGIRARQEEDCACPTCLLNRLMAMRESVVHKIWLVVAVDNPNPDLAALPWAAAKAFDPEKDGARIQAFLAEHSSEDLLNKYTPWAAKQRTMILDNVRAAVGKYAHPTSPEVVDTVNRVLKDSFGADTFRFAAV